MPSINWENAGRVGDYAPSVVNDFRGGHYVDEEIMGESGGGVPPGDFADWMASQISQELTTNNDGVWIQQPMAQRTMSNGCGEGEADVTAFRTQNGDRIEYWEGRNGDVDGDNCCFLETSSGTVLIAGCSMSHPFVCCNLFSFGNSDGSTRPISMDATSGASLLRSLQGAASTYCYNQRH